MSLEDPQGPTAAVGHDPEVEPVEPTKTPRKFFKKARDFRLLIIP
jgi:hypothetical protein